MNQLNLKTWSILFSLCFIVSTNSNAQKVLTNQCWDKLNHVKFLGYQDADYANLQYANPDVLFIAIENGLITVGNEPASKEHSAYFKIKQSTKKEVIIALSVYAKLEYFHEVGCLLAEKGIAEKISVYFLK